MRSMILAAAAAAALALPLSLASAPAALAQASDPAVGTVNMLDQGLLSIMKAGKAAGLRGRTAAIGPVVDRVYDLPLMTRLAVGPSWTSIPAGEQAALVAAFRRLTVSQYASNFDGYSGQSFFVDPRVEQRGTDKLVRTTLRDPKGESVSIAYRLRQDGGSWKVIDVFYKNAISQLATRRSDFAGVLAKGGAKALVAHLNALAAKSGG